MDSFSKDYKVWDAGRIDERARNVALLRARANEIDELADAKRREHDRIAAHSLLCVALELGKMADAIEVGEDE